jgi:arylsulfatase A-like enzyme
MTTSRRDFLKRSGTGLLAMTAGSAARGEAPAGRKRPNLLIVHTDEHHFNTLGCYGGRIVETPHIDWIAKNGALATSFYATMFADVEVPIPRTLHKTAEQTPKWGPPEKNLGEANLRKIMPPYYGMVKCIDDNVGRVLATLRTRGLLENTIVVFTADHGDLCGEHGRLNKGVPYEGSAKIPFVIRYPEKIKAGTVIDEALSCVDFLPTIIRLMGFDTLGTEQGRDASSLFTGETPSDWNDVVFMRGTGNRGWLSAVTNDYKLIFSPQDRPWLFDLKKDPDELDNRFEDPAYAAVVKRLSGQLLEYCKKYNDPSADDPKMRAEMVAAAG